MLALLLAVLSLVSPSELREMPAESRRALVVDVAAFLRSECVVFVRSDTGDFLSNSATIHSMKRLSAERPSSALTLTKTLGGKDSSGRPRRPCNRPLHVIQDLDTLRTTTLYHGPIWLLLHAASLDDADLYDVDVRFDVQLLVATPREHDVVLEEVYRVAEHLAIRSNAFGTWRPGSGLSGPDHGLYERRPTLTGLDMRVGVIHNPPFSYVEQLGNKTVLGGFVGRLWEVMQRRLNVTSQLVLPPSGLFGNPLGNGTWDGMVGMLMARNVHCTASALAPNAERFALVDFSFAIYTLHPRVFIHQPEGREPTWTSFLLPFEPRLWLAFVCVGVAVAAVTTLVADASVADAAFQAFTALFCQQSHDEQVEWSSAMIVHFVALIVGTIGLTCYGGLLYSNLAVSRPWTPFSSLQGLLEDASYSLGVINNTYWNAIFNWRDNALYGAVLRQLGASPLPEDSVDGYRRVCASRMAFVGTLEESSRRKLNCTLAQLSDRMISAAQSFGLPKLSPYRGLVNHNLVKLRSNGVLRLLYQSTERWVPVDAPTELPGIELEAVVPILAFAALGLGVALCVLLGELLVAGSVGKRRREDGITTRTRTRTRTRARMKTRTKTTTKITRTKGGVSLSEDFVNEDYIE